MLFVCTANDESTIPGPLKDRMEIIRLSGYDIPEKVAIATRYLVPKALKEAGLQEASGKDINCNSDFDVVLDYMLLFITKMNFLRII